MRSIIFLGLLGGLLAGCAAESGQQAPFQAQVGPGVKGASTADRAVVRLSQIAKRPDRGNLLAYSPARAQHRGASTWRAVEVSESHALNSIATGEMRLTAPSGAPIALRYERHYEHPDGSWSWIGHPAGAKPGVEAVITFGEKAVFGTIPNGTGEPLQLTTAAGRTWMIESDDRHGGQASAAATASEIPDFLPPPAAGVAGVRKTSAAGVAVAAGAVKPAAADGSTVTVDIVLGYTSGFAMRLGGQSQAVTRLQNMVTLANEAYQNSGVNGTLRLVRTVQVDYPDDTNNRAALYALTGVQCTGTTGTPDAHLTEGGVVCEAAERPAGLQPLIDAREESGADLVSLVRNFTYPENGSCGAAWLLGGGQTPIDASSADFAFSVVSDSNGNQFPSNANTCRQDYLAHETGHNMGLQHDVATAQGNDDTNSDGNPLDPDEYGRFPYSFGYSTDESAGNFYTVMAVRRSGQQGYLVFSNPLITFCGGLPCGVADQADNARTLAQTMPLVAAFRNPSNGRSDFDGDGKSDILWRNGVDGRNTIWRSGDAATSQSVATANNFDWKLVGIGDFNGDAQADILWRNTRDGRNSVWWSADAGSAQMLTSIGNLDWAVAGVADFDGDGKADILWRNRRDGRNTIWRSANASTTQSVATAGISDWALVATDDFDGDGKADILWRNGRDGRNSVWWSADAGTAQMLTAITNLDWIVAGAGDFDGDGKSDILWHNNRDGRNTIWRGANARTPQTVTTITNLAWVVVDTGDYDGDGRADLLWRNVQDGRNTIWLSAVSSTQQSVTTLNNMAWQVMRPTL